MSSPSLNDSNASADSVAALAITWAEMGYSDRNITTALIPYLDDVGLHSSPGVRSVAHAVARLPQPPEVPADERERRRPVEDMLGVTSAEDQLSASLRARELLERLAQRFEQYGE